MVPTVMDSFHGSIPLQQAACYSSFFFSFFPHAIGVCSASKPGEPRVSISATNFQPMSQCLILQVDSLRRHSIHYLRAPGSGLCSTTHDNNLTLKSHTHIGFSSLPPTLSAALLLYLTTTPSLKSFSPILLFQRNLTN